MILQLKKESKAVLHSFHQFMLFLENAYAPFIDKKKHCRYDRWVMKNTNRKAGNRMAAMDEFRELRDKIKEQPLKKKISYIWYYYKWFIMGGITLIAVIIGTIHGFMTRTENLMYGVVVNAVTYGDDNLLIEDFSDYAQIDTKEYDVRLNDTLVITDEMNETTINSTQTIMVYMSAEQLDITVMDPNCFRKLAYNDIYLDLRTCLSKDELEALDGKLYYIDMAALREIDALAEANVSTEVVVTPDPLKPEEMEEPVPVGIDVSNCQKLTDVYHYEGGVAYLGITNNTNHIDMVKTFLTYISAFE